ncbi:Pre-mRNA-splicing factor cwc26 [Borealophlyctis nickersoniae]|nr:Pre-mRNA-splicing factor cwc26 [Borealophlyctis nickersoniae]
MSQLKDYLRKYMSSDTPDVQNKKKKKKRPKPTSGATAVAIIDEDAVDWTKQNGDPDEDAPVVVEAEVVVDEGPKFRGDTWETIREGEAVVSEDRTEAVVARDGEGNGKRRRRSPSASASPPPRGRRGSPSPSPPPAKRGRRSPSASASPPPRRRRNASPSPSPEPNGRRRSRSPISSSRDDKARMSDGRSTGLQAPPAKPIGRPLVNPHDPSLTGRGAETIYRDKVGRKVDLAAQKAELNAQRRKREAEEEKMMEWGKGYVQKREKEEAAKRLQEEASLPFAIYADNKDRNEELMERDRWGDPMAHLAARNKKKKGGDRPKYQGPPAPPNRYGIQPGYRWDGVDRSNGFESRLVQARYNKAALASEAYKWSSEMGEQMYEFDKATHVIELSRTEASSTWSASVSEEWMIGDVPHGGIVLSIILSAARGHFGPTHPDPISITAHYLRPSAPIPATIHITTLKTGRFSTAHATFCQSSPTEPNIIATVVFSNLSLETGPTKITDPEHLPPPSECTPTTFGRPSPNRKGLPFISDKVKVLMAPTPPSFQTSKAERRQWMRFADNRPPDAVSMAFFSDAFVPTLYNYGKEFLGGETWFPTMELNVQFRAKPPTLPGGGGWVGQMVRSRFLTNGRNEVDVELYAEDGTLLAIARQMALVVPWEKNLRNAAKRAAESKL